MTEETFTRALRDALEFAFEEETFPVDCARTFEESGVLTGNRGLVVRLEDGSEFQLTVVQSAWGDDGEEED